MHVRFVFVFLFNFQAESFVFKGDHFDFQAVFSESIRMRQMFTETGKQAVSRFWGFDTRLINVI